MRKQRSVAIVHQLIVLHAAALVLLAGCQKPGFNGNEIRFTATSQGAPGTKTQYSGVATGTPRIERINWVSGDKVRIYSDVATASNDSEYHWADYAVSNIKDSGATSKGELTVTSPQGGLSWGTGTHNFYAVYPAPASAEAEKGTVKGPAGSGIGFSIPASQTGTATTVKSLEDGTTDMTVYYPSTENAYLLAYASRKEADAAAPLDFSPAYTAFHISAGRADKDITINSVVLTSSTSALAGNVTATNDGSAWSYDTPDYSAGVNNELTFNFKGSAPVLTASNPTVDFVFYALPRDLTQLTLEFNLTIDGSPAKRTLELKTASDYTGGTIYGNDYTAGSHWLKFNACKKSYIKGLLIPGATWTIDTGTTIQVKTTAVKDWTEVKPDINYGTDPVINASGLDELDQSAHLYEFFIYSPTDATWQVKVLNASKELATGVTITREERPDSEPASGNGVLTGTVGGGKADAPGRVRFSLSGSGGPYTLSFSVKISVGGTVYEYPINTEVIRGDGSGNGFENGNYAPINL